MHCNCKQALLKCGGRWWFDCLSSAFCEVVRCDRSCCNLDCVCVLLFLMNLFSMLGVWKVILTSVLNCGLFIGKVCRRMILVAFSLCFLIRFGPCWTSIYWSHELFNVDVSFYRVSRNMILTFWCFSFSSLSTCVQLCWNIWSCS